MTLTVNEHYPLNPSDPNSETEPLVYTVPMRETMPSYKAASDAAKIVNINSWRPLTNKVNINIAGNSATDALVIKGDVYGGGNSATVQKVQDQNAKANSTTTGFIKINIGSHTKIGRVFMGCNGDALFTSTEDNNFMNKFQKLNGDINDYTKELNLGDTIDWQNDPSNKGISTLYLSTKNEDRPTVYPHLLDLYFQPVETDIQASLTWNGNVTGEGLEDCTIGTFCCGGNRGNMNVYPNAQGNAFEYTFPAGLTIIDKIVGGCNNANYNYKGKVFHEGGYLLGQTLSAKPFIKLNISNKFEPTESNGAYKGGNVYGGCYQTGTIRGDITIDLMSDMLKGKSKEKLEKSNELLGSRPEYSALNVYGAGYGMESYVYGNTDINVAETVKCKEPSTTSSDGGYSNTFNETGTSANFIYGGGQQGNVIGATNVDIFNGYVFKAVTGGSYSGYVWGSTQVKVGYPKYYKVRENKSGVYLLNRTDQNNKYIDREGNTENGATLDNLASETIKQSIKLIAGDLVTQAVYDSIVGKQGVDKFVRDNCFCAETSAPKSPLTWDDINIQIGEAIYGGGYSVAQGTSVLANNTTVLKFTDKYNIDNAFSTSDAHIAELKSLPNGTTKGFGGNTTILVADRTTSSSGGDTSTDRDHITISHQDMKPIKLPIGTDLFGYYYKHKDGNYRFISIQDKYFYGKLYPEEKDQNDNNIYQYDSEGGIFGDGHQSYAEGFRSADLTGYGFASHTINQPKIINTFQRLDILRLEDNCFNVLGARDYATNATNKTPYSLSRIGEIQMFANNIYMDGNNLKDKGEKRSRNYLGLANNIHYVGAVTSNVAFNDATKAPWHQGDGKLPTDGNFNGKSYQEVKQSYIDDYVSGDNKDNVSIFQKRNDGTAKNMIGIASGYALKIQNAQEFYEGASKKITDKIYYGPIYGVIEMNLIDVRSDEGGGYVYADNVHKRTAKKGETAHAVDFLETTGNFVFPYTAEEGRFIVDDCFPTGYFNLNGKDPDTNVDVHYWYVTGFNYYYNAHITGYTYQSPNKFYSDNTDGLTVLSGLKAKQPVSIVSWKMRSGHPESKDDYSCDLEYRNYLSANTEGNVDKDGKDVSGKYKLYISASDSTKYDDKNNGFAALLPMNATGKYEGEYIHQNLPEGLVDDAKISFMLDDNVNNTTSDYFNKHLSEKCQATIVLSAPAYKSYTDETTNEPIISKVASSEFFTYNESTKEYTKVPDGENLVSGKDYYIYNGIAEEYTKIFYVSKKNSTDGTYIPVTDISTIKTGSENYYCDVQRYYTYTIYLTIEYVQGPNIKGNITIENCALPGEIIRIKKNDVVITADESFSANGYYWRIGKCKKDADGKLTFEDTTDWEIGSAVAQGYDTYKQGDKEGTGVFSGCVYDQTEDYLDIPAYYYMNGYGVQLGVTMNGLDKIFPVDMQNNDTLVIHNYHKMYPGQAGVHLQLAKAIARAHADKNFAEPRIYINDHNDLTTFINFVDTIGTGKDGGYVAADGKEYVQLGAKKITKDGVDTWVANLCEVPRYGANAQFVVQNNITIASPEYDGSTHADFAGTAHGNGHVITGLPANHCLFNSISGNVYNLGLVSGKISNMKPNSNDKIENYHCCFELNPGSPSEASETSSEEVSTPVVYHMDGTVDTHYTTADFRSGRVAYDLNEYYLRARYSNKKDNKDDMAALKYVYDYYTNGDYQYAHRSDAITGRETGITYLRTGKDGDLPNYGQSATRHDKTHTIDKARRNGATYEPLFDGNHEVGATIKMNDFLFWGQSLQSTPADYPSTIGYKEYTDNVFAHLTNRMTNRVYRTAGYYGDTKLDAFHYNAYNYNGSSMDTYVHNTKTTAIDFTCQNDLGGEIGMSNASEQANGIYYPPVMDNAEVFHNFIVKNGVSQNLLVYTAANDEEKDNEAYDAVNKALTYDEEKKELNIEGHHIYKNGDEFITPFLHLVERTPNGQNSEGEDCDNNDFCAPIQFSVTDRAWYTRKPQYYAEKTEGSWEGICLPFTVDKVEASRNGEITHFYGTPSEKELADPRTNTHTLHHEYWLRGLASVSQNSDGNTAATFQRPGIGNSNEGTVSYNFDNLFFINTYDELLYNKVDNQYYTEPHTYYSYPLQSANVPYVVRFPGERYYEFDLSSAFYSNITGIKASAQTVTFNAYGINNTSNDLTIPVTATNTAATTVGGFTHQGTFSAIKVANKSVYGMNDEGTAFDDASTLSNVMPFRTYMSVASNGKTRAAAPSVIHIAETTGIDNITPEGGDKGEVAEADQLTIRPISQHRVRIESTLSTQLYVYTLAGQLFRILDIQEGTSVYSGFPSGVYLFGKTKVAVK